MVGDPGTNQSVERAASILDAFLDGRPKRTSDVAEYVGLGQSTASRLLGTLEAIGYVERLSTSGLYTLGPKLITLAGIAVNGHPVHREARQRAQELAATLGLGVNIAERRGDKLFYLCNFEGRLAPKSFMLMGQPNPLHATALGKCLLLGTSAAERRTLLPELRAFTQSTVTTQDALDAVIDRARSEGYATEVEELALGRACIATPILNHLGEVTAALSVSGPLSEISLEDAARERELAGIVIESADAISTGLGYQGPVHAARSGSAAP